MTYNKDKVDEITLALLYLVMTQDREGRGHGKDLTGRR